MMKYIIGIGSEEVDNIERGLTQIGLSWQRIENPRSKVCSLAREQIGKLYKYGASVLKDAPNFFDCSSLTSWLYTQSGISLPRISVDQYVFGEEINLNDARPGDLIFSNTHKNLRNIFYSESKEFKSGTKVSKPIDHCGIFMGDSIIHATESKGFVIEELLNESEYFKDIIGARKIPGVDSARYVIIIPNDKVNVFVKEGIISQLLKN